VSNIYSGMMALYYDEIYKSKPYDKEALFLHTQIQKHFPNKEVRILELACGSGNHSIKLAEYGYQIIATDISEESINIARNKNSHNNLRFELLDMLKPAELGKFDVIICLFDSIGYLLTNHAIRNLFNYVRQALNPHGLFIYEYWYAGAFLKNFEQSKYRYIEQLNLHRVSLTKVDHTNQIANVEFKFFRDGQYYEELHKNRFFLTQEMSLFIETGGFQLCNRYEAYTPNTLISDNTWHILDIIKPI